jgi:methylglutaconyl-CoA hydratase
VGCHTATVPMMGDLVRLDVGGGVATITLDSPANRNALSRQLVAECNEALDAVEARADDDGNDVRAIVLTHTPPVFCAGADLKERAAGVPDSGPFVRLFTRLMDAPQPTIAAVKGPVRAGGIGLMASCDLVVVRGDVEFALTEVRLGLAAAMISVPIFRRVNSSHLAAAFLTGETFSTDHARGVGLVTHVAADDGGVDAAVAALCEGIMLGAPTAVAVTKQILRDVPTMPRDKALAAMAQLSDTMFASDDAAEGMRAFAEKRPPRWQS